MTRAGYLRKCVKCGRYTLDQEKCPVCGAPVRTPHPPKFSPDDRFARYRLAMKIISGELRIELSEEEKARILERLLKVKK